MRKLTSLTLIALAVVLVADIGSAQVAPGSKPPLPIGYGYWKQLQSKPAEMERLGADLPPVQAATGPQVHTPALATAGSPASPLSPENAPVGGWTNLATTPGASLSNPLLLTDGTVIAHVSCSTTWWKLTPDINGSYVNGTWSTIAGMPAGHSPRFFGSSVLPDGRVIVEGGEYNGAGCTNVWTNKGSIYDPVADFWLTVTPPSGWAQIGDSQSIVLPNGTYLQADCCDFPGTKAALFDARTFAWTTTGSGKFDYYDEEGFTLLPNGSVLSVDAYVGTGTCGSRTELYDYLAGTWSGAGNTPNVLADCSAANAENSSPTSEMGPQALMYNGSVIAFGANTLNTVHSALYSTGSASWSAGPDLPSTCGSPASSPCNLADAPAAVMPNGNVLFAANSGAFHTPVLYFEYDPTANSISPAPATADASIITAFEVNFVVLPTGQILEVSTDTNNVQIYTPSGIYQAVWQPAVSSAPSCVTPGGTYLLSGTQFNGLTEGAYYGDDQVASSNYPIVRIVNNATGHVFYGRTFGHSSRSIATNAATSTYFRAAAGTETGASTLYVVANGIPSAGTAITVSNGCFQSPRSTHDLNGNGWSDIAWRDSTGNTAVWLMAGAQVAGAGGLGNVPTSWSLVAQRDFDGDGKTDWLWRDNAGNTAVWFLDGFAVTSTGFVGNVGTTWSVVGSADLNGDGKGDILWRDGSGNTAVWLMNGAAVLSNGGLGNVPNSWSLAAVADFNGDGKGDILWRDGSGNTVIWFMNGTTVASSSYVGNVATTWTLIGTGDFNGDGKSDLAWRDSSGNTAFWLMNGAVVLASGGIGNVPTAWNLPTTGDYDGDGKSDLLWSHSTGATSLWFMNGMTVASTAGFGTVTGWAIQGGNAE